MWNYSGREKGAPNLLPDNDKVLEYSSYCGPLVNMLYKLAANQMSIGPASASVTAVVGYWDK
jgi:hypothetical protein